MWKTRWAVAIKFSATIHITVEILNLPLARFSFRLTPSAGSSLEHSPLHPHKRSCLAAKHPKSLFLGRHFWVSQSSITDTSSFFIPQYLDKYIKFACSKVVFRSNYHLLDLEIWVTRTFVELIIKKVGAIHKLSRLFWERYCCVKVCPLTKLIRSDIYSGSQVHEGHFGFQIPFWIGLIKITVPHQPLNRCMRSNT